MTELVSMLIQSESVPVEIRPMTGGDLTAVVGIHEVVTRRKATPDCIHLIESHLTSSEGVRLVALAGGEVIGFVCGQIRHGDLGLEDSGWIEMIGVKPNVRGQGVGQALAMEALNRFRHLGTVNVYTALPWYSGDLMSFFKHIGFNLSDYINLKAGQG